MLPGRWGAKHHGAWFKTQRLKKTKLFTVQKPANAPLTKNELAKRTCFSKRVWTECWTDVYWPSSLEKNKTKTKTKTTTTRTEAHWHANTDTERHEQQRTHTLSLCLTHTPEHTHTHTFMTTNWISSVWGQGLLLWRQQVFRRGDGHRKEGGILSTRSFPLLGVRPVAGQKEMDGKKERRRGWQKAGASSVTGALPAIRPELPAFHTSSSSLCLSPTPSSPLFILLYSSPPPPPPPHPLISASHLHPPPLLCASSPHRGAK